MTMILYGLGVVREVFALTLKSIDWQGLEWRVALIVAVATVLNTVLMSIAVSYYKLAAKKLDAAYEKDKLLIESALSNEDRYWTLIDKFCELAQVTHAKIGDVSVSLKGLGEATRLLVDETEKLNNDTDDSLQALREDVAGTKKLLIVLCKDCNGEWE